MSRGRARTVLILAWLVLFAGPASADPPPVVLCKASPACLQQMVDDLRQYREYLEDQLALAKSLLNDANARIRQQTQEIETLKKKDLPPAPGKP